MATADRLLAALAGTLFVTIKHIYQYHGDMKY
jgi:hypothetical protein